MRYLRICGIIAIAIIGFTLAALTAAYVLVMTRRQRRLGRRVHGDRMCFKG